MSQVHVSAKYEGFPRRIATIFFATNLLCNSLNMFIWIYYTPHFSTYLHQLQQPCTSEKQEQIPPSCINSSFFYFFDNFVITPKLFLVAGVFEGYKEVEIWRSKIWAVWWWGGKFHLCFHLQRTSPYRATFTSLREFARKSMFYAALQ